MFNLGATGMSSICDAVFEQDTNVAHIELVAVEKFGEILWADGFFYFVPVHR